jgi:hypothetical protein
MGLDGLLRWLPSYDSHQLLGKRFIVGKTVHSGGPGLHGILLFGPPGLIIKRIFYYLYNITSPINKVGEIDNRNHKSEFLIFKERSKLYIKTR